MKISKKTLMVLCFFMCNNFNLFAGGDLKSNLEDLKSSLQNLESMLNNLNSQLGLLIIKSQISQAEAWDWQTGSFRDGITLLPDLQASINKIINKPEYSSQFEELRHAFLQLHIKIINGAEDRLADLENKRYVISDYPNATRLSAGFEAIKSLQYLKGVDLKAFPDLKQEAANLLAKEEEIKSSARGYLQGAKNEHPEWGVPIIAEFEKLISSTIPTVTMERKNFGPQSRVKFFTNIMGVDELAEMGKAEKDPYAVFDLKNKFESDQLIKNKLITDPDPSETKSFKIKGVDGDNNNVVYQCGFFEKISLGYLRQEAAKKVKQDFGPITFNVIEAERAVVQGADLSSDVVDIGALQANPANKNAVFQVASNFNALETTSHKDKISNITQYIFDLTQGPSASISAAPGLIYRHYCIFYKKGKDASTWKQRPQDAPSLEGFQINLLQDLGIKTMNGYIWGEGKNKAAISKDSGIENIADSNADKFCVGYHSNVQVTFGGKRNNARDQEFFYDPSQIIDQIFIAALVTQSAEQQSDDRLPGATDERAKLILDWIYEATLKAAFVNGKRDANGKVKVFLTRMGGGAFSNKQNWIDDAIIKAMNDFDLKQSGLVVTLNNFYVLDDEEEVKKLIGLVQKTNGKYIRYNPDGVYYLTLAGAKIIATKIN